MLPHIYAYSSCFCSFKLKGKQQEVLKLTSQLKGKGTERTTEKQPAREQCSLSPGGKIDFAEEQESPGEEDDKWETPSPYPRTQSNGARRRLSFRTSEKRRSGLQKLTLFEEEDFNEENLECTNMTNWRSFKCKPSPPPYPRPHLKGVRRRVKFQTTEF